jgi:hypothetical protein
MTKLTNRLPLPLERDQAQDGEYTGPADNPPGYAGQMYETNNLVHYDRESGQVTPVADCYSGTYADALMHAANCHNELVETLDRAVRWLRRIQREYPGSVNDDAIDKHLIPVLNRTMKP